MSRGRLADRQRGAVRQREGLTAAERQGQGVIREIVLEPDPSPLLTLLLPPRRQPS